MTKIAATLLSAILLAGPTGAALCVACCPQEEAPSVSSLPACCGDCPSTIERQPAPASSPSKTTLDDTQPVTLLAPGPASVVLVGVIRPVSTLSRGVVLASASVPAPLRL
jgi:hypothetical protein